MPLGIVSIVGSDGSGNEVPAQAVVMRKRIGEVGDFVGSSVDQPREMPLMHPSQTSNSPHHTVSGDENSHMDTAPAMRMVPVESYFQSQCSVFYLLLYPGFG